KAAYGSTVENLNVQLKEWLVDHGEALTGIDQMMWLDDNDEFTGQPTTNEQIQLHFDNNQHTSPRNLN
ncbi:MAG: hypothetical protein V4629_06790, partial [Pseudomonadota bacterium]